MGRVCFDDDLLDLSRHEMNEAARVIAREYASADAKEKETEGDSNQGTKGQADNASGKEISKPTHDQLIHRDKALLEFLKRREGL